MTTVDSYPVGLGPIQGKAGMAPGGNTAVAEPSAAASRVAAGRTVSASNVGTVLRIYADTSALEATGTYLVNGAQTTSDQALAQRDQLGEQLVSYLKDRGMLPSDASAEKGTIYSYTGLYASAGDKFCAAITDDDMDGYFDISQSALKEIYDSFSDFMQSNNISFELFSNTLQEHPTVDRMFTSKVGSEGALRFLAENGAPWSTSSLDIEQLNAQSELRALTENQHAPETRKYKKEKSEVDAGRKVLANYGFDQEVRDPFDTTEVESFFRSQSYLNPEEFCKLAKAYVDSYLAGSLEGGKEIGYTRNFPASTTFLHGAAKDEFGRAYGVCDTYAQTVQRVYAAGGYDTQLIGSFLNDGHYGAGHIQVVAYKTGTDGMMVQNNDHLEWYSIPYSEEDARLLSANMIVNDHLVSRGTDILVQYSDIKNSHEATERYNTQVAAVQAKANVIQAIAIVDRSENGLVTIIDYDTDGLLALAEDNVSKNPNLQQELNGRFGGSLEKMILDRMESGESKQVAEAIDKLQMAKFWVEEMTPEDFPIEIDGNTYASKEELKSYLDDRLSVFQKTQAIVDARIMDLKNRIG